MLTDDTIEPQQLRSEVDALRQEVEQRKSQGSAIHFVMFAKPVLWR